MTILQRAVSTVKRWRRPDRGWPHYLPGGRLRTSTVGLLIAFFLLLWVYQTYQPAPPPPVPDTQIVPPGFVPDPEYTWVPRTSVREYPRTTTPEFTPTPTTTTETTTTETTPEPPPTTEAPDTTTTPTTTTPPNPFMPTPPTPETTPTTPPAEPGPPPVPPIPGF